MSLSPVTGTEVSETGVSNGVVTPVLPENGPQIPASVKYAGGRVSPSGDHPQDAGNYVDVESRVSDGDGCLEVYNHEGTSASPSLTSSAIGDSETCSRDSPQESEGQASSNRQQTGTEKLHESADGPEEEEDDGEKEKQDEEEDEKNDSKWVQPHVGGRTKAEVGEV